MATSDSSSEQGVLLISSDSPQEDIFEELDLFVRLGKLGHFKEGHLFFEDTLRPHVQQFPVAAEYADFLLSQGNFKLLEAFTDDVVSNRAIDSAHFALDELQLFKLFSAIAQIHTHGSLRPAVDEARAASNFTDQCRKEDMSDVQRQILLLRLRIFDHVDDMSSFIDPQDYRLPSSKLWGRWLWHDYIQWFQYWLAQHHYWDGHALLDIYLGHRSKPWRVQESHIQGPWLASECWYINYSFLHRCLEEHLPQSSGELTNLVRMSILGSLSTALVLAAWTEPSHIESLPGLPGIPVDAIPITREIEGLVTTANEPSEVWQTLSSSRPFYHLTLCALDIFVLGMLRSGGTSRLMWKEERVLTVKDIEEYASDHEDYTLKVEVLWRRVMYLGNISAQLRRATLSLDVIWGLAGNGPDTISLLLVIANYHEDLILPNMSRIRTILSWHQNLQPGPFNKYGIPSIAYAVQEFIRGNSTDGAIRHRFIRLPELVAGCIPGKQHGRAVDQGLFEHFLREVAPRVRRRKHQGGQDLSNKLKQSVNPNTKKTREMERVYYVH